jgi:hypothetical protein
MAELDIIIIEDEQKAAADLAAQLIFLDPKIEVIATLDSVAGSVNWLLNNQCPTLCLWTYIWETAIVLKSLNRCN